MISKEFKFNGSYKVKYEMYNSASEMVELLKTRPITDSSFHDYRQGLSNSPSWHGVESLDKALEMLDNGYDAVINDMKGKLNTKIAQDIKRISFGNDVVGYAPIVPLVLQGVPQNMVNSRMKPIKAKVIDIYYDITVNCGTNSKDIIKNGTNILGAILELEKQGYRINLYAIQSYSGSYDADMVIIKIKDSNQPFDLKRMSFPLTHTAFFRVIGFDWYSRFPQGKYRYGYGHNLKQEFGEQKATQLIRELTGNKNAVCLYGASLLNKNEEHIKEMLKNESGNCKC